MSEVSGGSKGGEGRERTILALFLGFVEFTHSVLIFTEQLPEVVFVT